MPHKKQINPFDKLRIDAELRRSIKKISKEILISFVALATILWLSGILYIIPTAQAALNNVVIV